MTTLRDIWKSLGLDHNEAAKKAKVGVATLYKMNRKEDVNLSTAIAVCDALGITLDEYRELDECPHADEYKPKGRTKKGHHEHEHV